MLYFTYPCCILSVSDGRMQSPGKQGFLWILSTAVLPASGTVSGTVNIVEYLGCSWSEAFHRVRRWPLDLNCNFGSSLGVSSLLAHPVKCRLASLHNHMSPFLKIKLSLSLSLCLSLSPSLLFSPPVGPVSLENTNIIRISSRTNLLDNSKQNFMVFSERELTEGASSEKNKTQAACFSWSWGSHYKTESLCGEGSVQRT